MSLVHAEIPNLMRKINEEMPILTQDSFRYKKKFSNRCMPKSLSEDMQKVNNKFLDNYLGKIEDTMPKTFLKQFIRYQLWNFSKNESLKKDSIFSSLGICSCPTKKQLSKFIYRSMGLTNFGIAEMKLNHIVELINTNFILGNMNTGAYRGSCIPGSDSETGSTGSTTTGWSNQNHGTKHTVTKNTCFDRTAWNIHSAAGNQIIGCYDNNGDDSGNDAENLLASISAYATTTSYTWKSITEFTSPDAILWNVQNADSGSLSLYYNSTGTRSAKTVTYPTLDNPYNPTTYLANFVTNNKVGHT